MTNDEISTLTFMADELPHSGYEINRHDRKSGQVRFGPGSLYMHIRNLVADGLLEEVTVPANFEGDKRQYYRITPMGLKALEIDNERP